jgi:hypothetical protein
MTDVRRDSAEAGEVKTEYNFKHGGTENTEEYKKNEIQMSITLSKVEGVPNAMRRVRLKTENFKPQTINKRPKTSKTINLKLQTHRWI